MKITQKWLKEKGACRNAVKYFKRITLTGNKKLLDRLEKDGRLDWANWGITRMLNHDGQIKYAIFAAGLVLDVYEKRFPEDKCPRKAIEAAKQYLKTKSEEDRKAAANAANAAYAADAAYAAANAANAAAYAANAAYARNTTKRTIIEYGVSLLKTHKA